MAVESSLGYVLPFRTPITERTAMGTHLPNGLALDLLTRTTGLLQQCCGITKHTENNMTSLDTCCPPGIQLLFPLALLPSF